MQPEIRTPQFIVQTTAAVEKASYQYLTWSYEHPFANALLKTAGGLALVGALQVIPSPSEIAAGLSNISQGIGNILNNLSPQPVYAASLPEQLQQATEMPPCTIPDTITIVEGGSISSQLWPHFEANGITGDARLTALDMVTEHIKGSYPNPDQVHAGDVIEIPREPLCNFAGRTIVTGPSATLQTPAAVNNLIKETLSTNVCGLSEPLIVPEGGTVWSTIRNALSQEGVPQEQINRYYEQILAFNSSTIPDPANVIAGTEIKIPVFDGCGEEESSGLLFFLAAAGIIGGSIAFSLNRRKK